jgi:Response regulator containing a CheY-like receiver domain and an HD-GYP domain
MITAYGDPSTRRKALEGGAEALLTKPIDFVALRSEIDNRVAGAGAVDPLRALASFRPWAGPVFLRKRTSSEPVGMSQECRQPTSVRAPFERRTSTFGQLQDAILDGSCDRLHARSS